MIHEGNYHPIKYFRLITQICRQQLIGLRSLEDVKDNKMSEFLVQISSAAKWEREGLGRAVCGYLRVCSCRFMYLMTGAKEIRRDWAGSRNVRRGVRSGPQCSSIHFHLSINTHWLLKHWKDKSTVSFLVLWNVKVQSLPHAVSRRVVMRYVCSVPCYATLRRVDDLRIFLTELLHRTLLPHCKAGMFSPISPHPTVPPAALVTTKEDDLHNIITLCKFFHCPAPSERGPKYLDLGPRTAQSLLSRANLGPWI